MIMKRTLLASLSAAAILLSGALLAVPTHAQQIPADDQPATFAADEMSHDQTENVVTARGHVEVNHGERTLLADSISYNQNTDTLVANGNIALHLPAGEILFAESMEITGDLKNGLISDLRAVMKDRSRFAAKQAKLVNDETLTMDRAVYSPCEQCKTDPTRPLLWQLKAIKIVHDRTKKIISYYDAR